MTSPLPAVGAWVDRNAGWLKALGFIIGATVAISRAADRLDALERNLHALEARVAKQEATAPLVAGLARLACQNQPQQAVLASLPCYDLTRGPVP